MRPARRKGKCRVDLIAVAYLAHVSELTVLVLQAV